MSVKYRTLKTVEQFSVQTVSPLTKLDHISPHVPSVFSDVHMAGLMTGRNMLMTTVQLNYIRKNKVHLLVSRYILCIYIKHGACTAAPQHISPPLEVRSVTTCFLFPEAQVMSLRKNDS
jgi:hypothetical protein